MNFENFWYIVAESHELRPGRVLARRVLGERLAVFRGSDGRAVALQDRCIHRNSKLSLGRVEAGCLRCPYHGWSYDSDGVVVDVPSEGPDFQRAEQRRGKAYETCEQDDFVYVCLAPGPEPLTPFAMPNYGAPGFATVRLQNHFANNVTNCAENFIDIPHTVFVHPGIFRVSRKQKIDAQVDRAGGSVRVEYFNETDNLGWFSWFLNPGGEKIVHTDSFHMPNITSVEYIFGPHRRLTITSQSVPVTDKSTLVYTDLTYHFGLWTRFAGPILRWQSQKVIDQDIEALDQQMQCIEAYGRDFSNTRADAIHVLVESIREELSAGRDPRLLPDRSSRIHFWV